MVGFWIFNIFWTLLLSVWLLRGQVRQFESVSRVDLTLGVLMHYGVTIFALLMVLHVYGGDMMSYLSQGRMLASLMASDMSEFGPAVVQLLLQQEPTPMLPVLLVGNSTASMIAISGLLCLLLGPSIWGVSLVLNGYVLASTMYAYRALAVSFPQAYGRGIFYATVMLPSVIFWSSGLFKETLAILGVMLSFGGVVFFLRRGHKRALWALGAGVSLIALVKAYLLMPLTASSGIYVYAYRSMLGKGRVQWFRNPWQAALALVATVGALAILAQFFPQLTPEAVAKEAATLQNFGKRIQGGTSYTVLDGAQVEGYGTYLYLPIGLIFSLFRPFPTDVRNMSVALNFAEMMVLLYLWFGLLTRSKPRRLIRTINSSPMLLFCLTFVLLTGSFVGLATTNVGTLSRYRGPMMPFYACLLYVLWRHERRDSRAV